MAKLSFSLSYGRGNKLVRLNNLPKNMETVSEEALAEP